MKRWIITLLCGLMLVLPAQAERMLPQDMDMAVLQSAQFPEVVLTPDGFSWLKFLTIGWLDQAQSFRMTPAVRIRNQQNLFITYGNLSRFAGQAVAVRRSLQNQITEIWILTEEEREVFRKRAAER